MSTPLDSARWRTSSYSHPNSECVAVARMVPCVGMRDSKAPHAGRLTVPPSAFDALLKSVRT